MILLYHNLVTTISSTTKVEEVSGRFASPGEFTSIIPLDPESTSEPPHFSALTTPRPPKHGWSEAGSESNSSVYRIQTSVGDRIHPENTVGGCDSALHSLFGAAPILTSGKLHGRYKCHRVEEKRQQVCDLVSGATSGLPLPLSSVKDFVLREVSGANQWAKRDDMISAIVSRFKYLKQNSTVPFSVGDVKLLAVVFELNISMVHRAPFEDGSMAIWKWAPKTTAPKSTPPQIVIIEKLHSEFVRDSEFVRGWIEHRRPESSPKVVTPIRTTGSKPSDPKRPSTIYGVKPRTTVNRTLFDPPTPHSPPEQ